MVFYGSDTVIPVYSVLAGIGLALTGLRFWVRTLYSRIPLGPDDLFIMLGVAMVCACTAIQYYNAIHGPLDEATEHTDSLEQDIITSRKLDWAMNLIDKPALGFTKLSILFFYRRIFGVCPAVRRPNLILIVVFSVWTVAFTAAEFLICGAHPELRWGLDQAIARGECGNRALLLLVFAATSVITNLMLLVLPLLYIARLHMSRKKKVASGLVLLIGFAAVVASILRLVFVITSLSSRMPDFAYSLPAEEPTPRILQALNPTFWITVEMWLGVWAANLPPCAPLLHMKESNDIWENVSEDGRASAWSRISETPPSLDGFKEFQWNATGHLCVFCRYPHDEAF